MRVAKRDVRSNQSCRESIVFNLAGDCNNLVPMTVLLITSSEHKGKVGPWLYRVQLRSRR